LAIQVPFKKAHAQSFARHCCTAVAKNKFIYSKGFKLIKLL